MTNHERMNEICAEFKQKGCVSSKDMAWSRWYVSAVESKPALKDEDFQLKGENWLIARVKEAWGWAWDHACAVVRSIVRFFKEVIVAACKKVWNKLCDLVTRKEGEKQEEKAEGKDNVVTMPVAAMA